MKETNKEFYPSRVVVRQNKNLGNFEVVHAEVEVIINDPNQPGVADRAFEAAASFVQRKLDQYIGVL